MKCIIEDCDSKSCSKVGYCNAHYIRWKRTGDANTPRKIGIRGLGSLNKSGYRTISGEYEHVIIAERLVGKPLLSGAEVHHVNEDKQDNRTANLVICPSHAYHMLLHRRARAYDACGHADWMKCCYCGKHDAPENMSRKKSNGSQYHLKCAVEYNRKRYVPGQRRKSRRSQNDVIRAG